MFPECNLKEPEVFEYLENVTEDSVRATLNKKHLEFSDLMNLISPAAVPFMPEMREAARRVKECHFGKTVRLYAPLYISNFCVNDCEYCGFKIGNRFDRKRLAVEDIIKEAKVIHSYGIESLLIVSGEDPRFINADFLVGVVKELREMFSYISIEIAPMPEADYRKLFEAGVSGLTLYQETYDRETYEKLHTFGPKKDYMNRLEFMEFGARAGFHSLGLGALLGLHDWRSEALSIAAHALYLRKRYWKSKFAFSFPRITAIEGGFDVPKEMDDTELEQMMLAYRLFFPESDLYISTRETNEFRKSVIKTCASHISAASIVVPGGYAEAENVEDADLEQFSLNDKRSVQEVASDIREAGMEPVFKDWDACIA